MNEEEHTKCPHCGTEYLEPVSECDWCPGVKTEPVCIPAEQLAA